MTTRTEARAAVYASFKTILTSIETLEQGLPENIDSSVWRTLSGSVKGQVWSAYKFLGFIDDAGNVQASLREIVSNRDNRNDLLKQLLLSRYSAVVEQADKKGSQTQFENAMREYNVQGETLEKAIRFYLQAAQHLDLPVSPHWKKKAGAPSTPKKGSSVRRGHPDQTPPPAQQPPPPASHAEDLMTVDLPSGGQVTLGLTDALMTKMSPMERKFVFELIDQMREFDEEQRKPTAAVDGRSVPAVIEPNKVGEATN